MSGEGGLGRRGWLRVTLKPLFPQESQAYWLDPVVPHLAEVLQLEDTPSIQVEVGVLVRDYPDIR